MMAEDDTHFLYFGYGSNLLKERLLLNNPTAVFKTAARLKDYKLDFDCWTSHWMGAVATITPTPGDEVWGAVWAIDRRHMDKLDRQEGVHLGYYSVLDVTVETPDGGVMTSCRTYRLCPGVSGSADRRPSPQYLDVIQRGAGQSGLPAEYRARLAGLGHNGYAGSVRVYEDVQANRI